jgi:hypothetical protein
MIFLKKRARRIDPDRYKERVMKGAAKKPLLHSSV